MRTSQRTRGPRTPDERAGDAARSAATLFEKVPPSHYADEILKPLAVLLRFDQSGSAFLDQEQTEEAADAYRDIVDAWRRIEEIEASHQRYFAGQAVRELNQRLAAAVDQLEEFVGIAGSQPRPKLELVERADK